MESGAELHHHFEAREMLAVRPSASENLHTSPLDSDGFRSPNSWAEASRRIREGIRTDLAELRQQIGADLQKLLDDRGILQTSNCHSLEVEETSRMASEERPLALLKSYTAVSLTNEIEQEAAKQQPSAAKKLSSLTRKLTQSFGVRVKPSESDTPTRAQGEILRASAADDQDAPHSPENLENGPGIAWVSESDTLKEMSSYGSSVKDVVQKNGWQPSARKKMKKSTRLSFSLDTTAGLGLRGKTKKERLAEVHDSSSCFRRNAEKIARSQKFELFIMVLIFVNSILVGVQTQAMAEARTEIVPTHFRAVDLVYLGICIAELILRIYVHGWAFFYMWGWVWNVFRFNDRSGASRGRIPAVAPGNDIVSF